MSAHSTMLTYPKLHHVGVGIRDMDATGRDNSAWFGPGRVGRTTMHVGGALYGSACDLCRRVQIRRPGSTDHRGDPADGGCSQDACPHGRLTRFLAAAAKYLRGPK